mgnify:FL=1|tara:strand:+ start:354 stop:1019 length:666 start_codon:yes stop_codon:yes gene_type:complete
MDNKLIVQIRKDIKAYEDKHPYTRNFYRNYTKALMEKLNVYIFNAQDERIKVPMMYANPERAIAKIYEDRNLTLPIISVAIGDIEENTSIRKPDVQLTTYKFFDVETQKAFRIIKQTSKAVALQFQITLWSKYTEDMNQMVEEVQMMFQPSLTLPTEDESENKAFLLDVLDMSSVQAADKQDRMLRKRVTLKVEAYIPGRQYLYSHTGRIKEVINQRLVYK